jgi:hypothetical protein
MLLAARSELGEYPKMEGVGPVSTNLKISSSLKYFEILYLFRFYSFFLIKSGLPKNLI